MTTVDKKQNHSIRNGALTVGAGALGGGITGHVLTERMLNKKLNDAGRMQLIKDLLVKTKQDPGAIHKAANGSESTLLNNIFENKSITTKVLRAKEFIAKEFDKMGNTTNKLLKKSTEQIKLMIDPKNLSVNGKSIETYVKQTNMVFYSAMGTLLAGAALIGFHFLKGKKSD